MIIIFEFAIIFEFMITELFMFVAKQLEVVNIVAEQHLKQELAATMPVAKLIELAASIEAKLA